jgi:hypothetical protein
MKTVLIDGNMTTEVTTVGNTIVIENMMDEVVAIVMGNVEAVIDASMMMEVDIEKIETEIVLIAVPNEGGINFAVQREGVGGFNMFR